MKKELTIEEVHDKGGQGYIPIWGGDDSNPAWDEYFEQVKDEFKPHFELIKKTIQEKGWIGMTGEEQQRENISFRFNDGIHFGFTWRAWGDLMQAIVNKKEGYMKYYM